MKFEDKIKELEKIIDKLENGETSLDDSIKEYTKAMKLAKECDKELKQIEDKITKIISEDGTIQDKEIE